MMRKYEEQVLIFTLKKDFDVILKKDDK